MIRVVAERENIFKSSVEDRMCARYTFRQLKEDGCQGSNSVHEPNVQGIGYN
jgi:hypothetical protein